MTLKVEEIFGHPVTSTLRLSPRGDAQEMWPLRGGRRAKVCAFLGEACYRSSGTRAAWLGFIYSLRIRGPRDLFFKRVTTDNFVFTQFLWILSQVLAVNMHRMYVCVCSTYRYIHRIYMYPRMCADMMYMD